MPRAEMMMKIIHGCNHIQQYGCNTVATIFNNTAGYLLLDFLYLIHLNAYLLIIKSCLQAFFVVLLDLCLWNGQLCSFYAQYLFLWACSHFCREQKDKQQILLLLTWFTIRLEIYLFPFKLMFTLSFCLTMRRRE